MSHWFEGVADHLGDAYLRYSFTCGTVSEVAALASFWGARLCSLHTVTCESTQLAASQRGLRQ